MSSDRPHRRIRSFVLRTGRMTISQQQALEKHWDDWGLELEQGSLDFSALAPKATKVCLEIGFGMGGSLVEMAKAAPDTLFVGVEVHTPGVGKLMASMEEEGVDNIRAYCCDAVEVLEQCVPEQSLDRVQIYFPDPWHKKKHNKRRLIQPDFVQLLRSRLKLGGQIHLATDWEHYAEHMMEVMCAAEGFSNDAGDYAFAERPEYRPVTKFERRGERLGHGVWDLLFTRDD